MKRSKEFLLATGLTIATFLGGVACAAEKSKVTDESGIEVTPQNAQARMDYLNTKAFAEMKADLKKGKATIVDGLCLGYTTTQGYNIVINPASYIVDNDDELFQLFAIAPGATSGSLEDVELLAGPYTYVQKDENGQQISATNMGFDTDTLTYKPLDRREVNVTPTQNPLQSRLWKLSTEDGSPAMFAANINMKPADFSAECQRMLAAFEVA